MSSLKLNDSVDQIPFVGDNYRKKLAKLNLLTVEDLLYHYPHRYLDRRQLNTIDEIQADQEVNLIAQVVKYDNIVTRNRKQLQKAVVEDETGKLEITWFNQPFLSRVIKINNTYSFSGKAKIFANKLTLSSPDFEWLGNESYEKAQAVHTGKLVPIYPETAGVSSKWLRSRIDHVLKNLDWLDPIPAGIKKKHKLIELELALNWIHQPNAEDEIDQAKKRLAFDELFLLQLQGAIRRIRWHQSRTEHKLTWPEKEVDAFTKSLPFELTAAQKTSAEEILADLQRSRPMNRLLEGDVGSGKTVVAALGLYASYLSKTRGVLMAPTEILAQQHYKELVRLFGSSEVSVGLITGSSKSKPDADIMVGTHALLFQQDLFNQVGLIVIDEQHRFGVSQRAKLEKLATHPHRLTMSATPIPRTVALTLYGDLDVSIIDQMPQNRKPVKTWLVPEKKRQAGYKWIAEQIDKGDQIFVVCPLIDKSEAIMLEKVRSASQEYKYLQSIFPQYKLALLHGRMKSEEKERIISAFKSGKIDILISTQVIEVGIDVPNATIMIIEAAERFGLAQLHQLRGRVGRGDKPGYCLLFATDDANSQRLRSLTKYHSGFKLAEIDLKLRGPGDVFGVTQHGFDSLKVARLSDKKLMAATKTEADDLVKSDPELQQYPLLKLKINQLSEQDISAN